MKTIEMRIRKNIAMSEEGFLFNPSTGDSFSTNAIGSDILQLLKQDVPSGEIVDRLCQKYDVESVVLERDLEEFMAMLREYNIME